MALECLVTGFAGDVFNAMSHAKTAGDSYRTSIEQIREIPTSYLLRGGESLDALAKFSLRKRASITGERVTDDSVVEEAARISHLNDMSKLIKSGFVKLYDQSALEKVAEKALLAHVPQIGELLKQLGVPEAHIAQGLAIQKEEVEGCKSLIGMVLVRNALATQAQVDEAFGQQMLLRDILNNIREEYF